MPVILMLTFTRILLKTILFVITVIILLKMHIIFSLNVVRNALIHCISSFGIQQPICLELLLCRNSILSNVINTVSFDYINEYIAKAEKFQNWVCFIAVYTAYVIVLPFKPVQNNLIHNNTICYLNITLHSWYLCYLD